MSVTTYPTDLPLELVVPAIGHLPDQDGLGLVLWDLDLVLLPSRRLDREAQRVAFARVTGRRPVREPPMLDQPDPMYAVELMCHNGFALIGARRTLPVYLPALARAYRALAEKRPWLLPRPCAGSVARLRRGVPGSDVVKSVVSAKIRPNARLTLAATGLDRYLDAEVGAFGSDHVDRARLVGIAVDRARRKYRSTFAPSSVVVVSTSAHAD